MVAPCILVYGLYVVTHYAEDDNRVFLSTPLSMQGTTSAPFPVHAMHGYELSFGHF
jgi:hypothetical protein